MNSWATDTALRFGGVALAGSFAIIMLAAGHGIGPVGLLLLFGAAREWIPGMIFGWLALILEFLAFYWVGKKKWKTTAALALGSFVTSAILFILPSETLRYFDAFFGAFLVPFLVIVIARVAQILSRRMEPNQLPEPTVFGRGAS